MALTSLTYIVDLDAYVSHAGDEMSSMTLLMNASFFTLYML